MSARLSPEQVSLLCLACFCSVSRKDGSASDLAVLEAAGLVRRKGLAWVATDAGVARAEREEARS